eukprot:13222395-Alexandrium_andersonii.AAC.1
MPSARPGLRPPDLPAAHDEESHLHLSLVQLQAGSVEPPLRLLAPEDVQELDCGCTEEVLEGHRGHPWGSAGGRGGGD